MAIDSDAAPRKRRRLRRLLVLLVLGPLLAIAAMPTLLSTGFARRGMLALANRYFAPARIDLGGVRLSWLAPLRLTGIVVQDPKGKRLLAIPKVALERSLLELVLDHSNLGTLTLEAPAIDVERRADGSIDLVDLFMKRARPPRDTPPPSSTPPAAASTRLPNLDLTLKIIKGSLQVRAPELPDPLKVDRFDMTAQMTAAAGPLVVRLRLENGDLTDTGSAATSLGIDGTFDLRAPAGTIADVSLNVLARHWPFSAGTAGVAARGQLDGQVELVRKQARWDLRGDARLLGLDVTAPALAGDRLRLDTVAAIWDVVQGSGPGSELWAVRRLSVTSPVASLTATGPILGLPGTGARVDGKLDLAALARQLPHALRIREGLTVERGEAGLNVSLGYEADAQTIDLAAVLSDVVAHDHAKAITLHSPAKIAARVTRRAANLNVEQLSITSDFVQSTGSGDLDRGIKVTGALDLGALQAQVRDLIDFGAIEMAGRGDYTITYSRNGATYSGALTSNFHGLDVKGLTTEPIQRGAVKLEAAVGGACDPSGLPRSLAELRVGLATGLIGAYGTAMTHDDTVALTLVAAGPLTLSEKVEGITRADVNFQGAWRAPALEVGSLRLNVQPANPPPGPAALALAVQGRFDSTKGELVLKPIAGTPPGALGLAAEGLHIVGLGRTAGATRDANAGNLKVEGSLLGDVAALDALIASFTGSTRQELAGSWTGRVSVQPLADGRLNLTARLDSPDLSRAGAPGQGRTAEGPFAMAVRAAYKGDGGELDFEELGLVTHYASLAAKGRVADATGRRVADLQGTIYPNWQSMSAMVVAATEPGARLQGGAPRAFRLKGPLSGGSTAEILKGLDAELGVDLASAQAFGLKLGATPLVVRCGGGRTVVDPIVTTLNNGRVDLRPEVVLDDPRGLALRLLPGSTLQNVEINDEVSQKVLSYIAPVLEQATHVHGSVSASFARAEFPIGGDADRTMAVNGAIVFNDVAFGAGPLGNELLSLAGKGPDTTLKLHQPLQLAILNRRIHQSGIVIPINAETRITVKGSVGFDQTLALRADVPVNKAMLGRNQALQDLAAGTMIPVPIGGTLTRPKVDRQALASAMREVTRSLLKRGAEGEASELLKRLSGERGLLRPRQ